jgi:rare lipoprotein A
MARRIAMAVVLVAGGCSSSDADVKGDEPVAELLDVSTTTTTTIPPATTSTVVHSVPTSSVRPSTSAPEPLTSASTAPVTPEDALPPAAGAVSHGKASWYARGTTTASGAPFDPDGLTAAHRTLAFGTRLSVCHDGCVVVEITDRGPARWTGRELDLSRAAFASIAPLGAGVVDVTWTEAA